MNCNEALERLLDAEPGELHGNGDTALVSHVRTCRRCGALARQLLADTDDFSLALTAVRRTSPVRRRSSPLVFGSLLATGVAALMLVVIVPRAWRSSAVDSLRVIDSAPAAVTAEPAAIATAPTDTAQVESSSPGTTRLAAPSPSQRTPSPRTASRPTASRPPSSRQPPAASTLRAYPAAIALSATRFESSPVAPPPARLQPASTVVVDAPAGRRAAVMRTDNPKLTVVWLY